jgi:hypothetical protein
MRHDRIVAQVCRSNGIGADGAIQYHNPSRLRREAMACRLRLYRDRPQMDIGRVVDSIYESDEYRQTLKKYIPITKHQNVARRIVDEIASLYDQPALRILGSSQETDRLRAEEKRLKLHEIMQEGHRLLTLCNEVLLWQFSGVDDERRLRIVTPNAFDAIAHPKDDLVPAAFLVDMAPASLFDDEVRARLPHYELWDDTYRYLINKQGHWVTADGTPATKPIEHGLGRIPGVLLHRREPTTCLLDADHGSDIESGHLAVALLNVMIMRLSKSQGERQPVLTGPLAHMAMGQVMNGERPLLLPPEVTASMLEMRTDPTHYLAVKKDVISSLGNTYGMSYEQFSMSEGADLASGKVYQLRREKLSEIRQESRRRAVVNESLVVQLIGFDPASLSIDYQEQALPQDPAEELSLLRDKMKMGLDSPVLFLMRKDSDLSRKNAIARIQSNLRDWAMLVLWSRALNAPQGADAEEAGASPEENGEKREADEAAEKAEPDESAAVEPDAA